jgi:hypothetical protein
MNASFRNPILCALRASFFLMPLGIPLAAVATDQPSNLPSHGQLHSPPGNRDPLPLIDRVRRATAQFTDINFARRNQWAPGTPCVSGPDSGAMGVHFLHAQGDNVDGVLNVDEPEALIYEPLGDGGFRLVGVEYIVIASEWDRLHEHDTNKHTPELEGNLLNYVGEPNRYGLPAFYELHVWAWEQNPNGSYADWNTRVSCVRQAGD